MPTISIEDLDVPGWNPPMTEYESIRAFAPPLQRGASRHRYTYEGNRPLDALLLNKGSDTLVVSLHGALNRTRFELPRFERIKSLRSYEINSLYFCDPTLYLDDSIQLTWYTGWSGADVQQDIAVWIQKAAEATGSKRVIISGSSGGGFAALQISALLPQSIALTFNPSVEIHGYLINGEEGAHGTERKYVEVVHPERIDKSNGTVDLTKDWTSCLGDEVSVIKRYSKPLENYVFYCQTPTDWHYDQHYLPFLAAAAKGDNLHRVKVHEYGTREGHFPPAPREFAECLDHALLWSQWMLN